MIFLRNLLFLLLLFISNISFAQEVPQKNWKKLIADAIEFERYGDIYRAALYFQAAYEQNKDRKDLAYVAGNYFLETREYTKAIKSLEEVKNIPSDSIIVKAGYKYAYCLKMLGRYSEAKDAFNQFLKSYKGDDYNKVKDNIEIELLGCEYGLKSEEYTNKNISIFYLDNGVNTNKTEFGPIPLNDSVLFFSSTASGTAKIFRTTKDSDGLWTKPSLSTIFTNKIEKTHYGNGSFSADGKRFFFTQCEVVENGQTRCQIYMMKMEGNKWSSPKKLPETVNEPNSNNTHPNVTVVDGEEILYFSSDRVAGKGGLDIWFSSRPLNSKDLNFTEAKNLGSNVNSWKNEITPFYYKGTNTLYFSSNGRNSAGGFDVFKVSGDRQKWDLPQNLGFPINSSYDDLYFIWGNSKESGFFISNRVFENKKFSTADDDLFYFQEEKNQLMLFGAVYSEKDPAKTPLREINLKVFEVDNGLEELVFDKIFSPAIEYKVSLEAGKEYLIEVSAAGFNKYTEKISTLDVQGIESKNLDIALKLPGETIAKVEPKFLIVPDKYNSKEFAYKLPLSAPVDPKTGKAFALGTDVFNAFKSADEIATKADERKVYWENGILKAVEKVVVAVVEPKKEIIELNNIQEPQNKKITSYKIQIAAVRNFKEDLFDELKKEELKKYKIEFEKLDGSEMTRVLIAPSQKNPDGSEGFKSTEDITKLQLYLLDHTRFKSSFVAKYENGIRQNGFIKGFNEDGSERD